MADPNDKTDELKAAYETFCKTALPHERAALDQALQAAHEQTKDALAGEHTSIPHPALALAWNKLHPEESVGTADGVASEEGLKEEFALPAAVDKDGLIWGVGKYQQLDPGWTNSLIQFLRFAHNKAPFATSPAVIQIPDETTLALVGDWGTGFCKGTGAAGVADAVKKSKPDYTVHLGDVYYAGNPNEEQERFVQVWPAGSKGSFALNSNHEMYSGAHPYFDVALASPSFAAQNRTSYFALVNKNWIIIGLDTAYFSSPDNLYMDGTIDAHQRDFVKKLCNDYPGRKIVVLSHHEGLDLPGEQTNALWLQVRNALGRVPDYWYFGHAHNAVVYKPRDGCRARCIGHGAVPYGVAKRLDGAPAVEWFEKDTANDDEVRTRVLNGFACVTLNGASLTEALIGEDGSTRWPR